MKRWIVLQLCCLLAGGLWAQHYSTNSTKAIKLYERGQKSLYQGDAVSAVDCFKQALTVDPDFAEANLMLAEWYYDQGDPTQSKQYYYAVVSNHPTFFTLAWLQLGGLELNEGNLDKAEECYHNFLQYDQKNSERHSAAQQGIATVAFRRWALQHPEPFDPQNMGFAINTADDEYLPALTVDGQTLIFTRRSPRKSTTVRGLTEEEDFYESHQVAGQWQQAVRMAEPVNSNDNEGAQCISQDGRWMFFTACGRPEGCGRCDLYLCVRKGDQWSKPRNLGPPVNTAAWESQPSFAIDGKTLYFVSDRKGGLGGMDIWKTVYEDGKGWCTPVNLGPEINTAGDEMSPYIHFDNRTLYFSSNGHIGMGGMDLFRAVMDDSGRFAKVENLGYPINTAGDETNLVVARDGRSALYSSDRAGGYGKQDLYRFVLPDAVAAGRVDYVSGTVTDAGTGAVVRAGIEVIDVETGRVVSTTNSDASNGEYTVSLPYGRSYAFHVSARGYLFYSANYDLTATDDGATFVNDIALSKVAVGETVTLRNVFFASGHYELLDESQAELNAVVELLRRNPQMKIEIGGHTDNVGTAEANQLLSQQRARTVYDYLVAQGIPSERLTYKGYGESNPVASNTDEAGRAQNRRTEFKIVGL